MISALARRSLFFAIATAIATSLGYIAALSLLDPRSRLLNRTPRPDPADVDARLTALGLDPHASIWDRYLQWAGGIVRHWDWGHSPDGRQVGAEIWPHALASAQLMLTATVLSLLIALLAGTYAAIRRGSASDRAVTAVAYLLVCLPPPVIYLAVQLGGLQLNNALGHRLWFITEPAPSSREDTWLRMIDSARGLALPTIALVLVTYCSYLLLHRAVLLDYLEAEHVTAARARGLTRRAAIWRHALRPAAIPLAQATAFALPAIFTGAFVVEAAFGRNGLGTYTLAAITDGQDVNATAACLAFGCAIFAIGATLADWAVTAVDPRTVRI